MGALTGAGRAGVVLAIVLPALACLAKTEPGDPLPGLTDAERQRFDRGREVFVRAFTPETGLGPLFNADACAACHDEPFVGGVGDEVEVHATALLPDGTCDALLDAGGPVYQLRVTPALEQALGITEEPIPERATGRARRTTPDILGFGFLDAVPEATILAHADPEDEDGDGVSGRPNRFLDGRLGRFGRKAFLPTLREFNAGAFPIEQGITNPALPEEGTAGGRPFPPGTDSVPDPELSADDLERTDDFVRFLAPPRPQGRLLVTWRARGIFSRIGCADCHLPRLRTGESGTRPLRYREVAAYTDLLLHDMGPELADICLGDATPSEFRTEPLMGLRFSSAFLHDGRARSIRQAIELHGGEGARSRDLFARLTKKERQVLLEFLGGL